MEAIAIPHKGGHFNAVSLEEANACKITRFVWMTNLKVSKKNIVKITGGGRLRWKIENEGCGIQKNGDLTWNTPIVKMKQQ